MAKITLNQHFINTITCTEGKSQERFYDTVITGFMVEIRSSGSKSYFLRFRDKNNRQRQHLLGSTNDITFEKARRAAEKARSKVVLGEDPSEEKRIKRTEPTFSEFIENSYLPFIRNNKRPSSVKGDISFLKNHLKPQFSSFHLAKITKQAIVDFQNSMVSKGYAPSMINRGLKLLRYIFNLSLAWDIPGIKTNPAVGVKLFAEQGKERFLKADETQRLLDAIENSKNTQLKYIVPLLLLLGCRKRELLDSRWEDFDLQKRSWYIPSSKTGSRHVPIPLAALEILNQLPLSEGCPYVVPNPETLKPFVQIHRSWDVARKKAGLPDVRMHDLRHSMASNMVNSGRSIYEVAKVLGHSQLKTTQRYAHLSQETLLEAVDAAAKATGTDWGQAHRWNK